MTRHSYNLRLSAAARLFGEPRPSPSTLNRWCDRGVTGPGGGRIVLRSQRRGRYRFTSEEACREFLERLNLPTHEEADEDLQADGM